ncbi:LysR substrate-binding domain-containing protein [Pseudomonas abietaniphila]|uniref:LysR family transcriptional regulator, glycine cleavage system transcriptional activator n=1 Tax=Pseudomonas abietaniphila TaxID=89065 RepID=A0A1G7V8X6_9PSED|nr:LysR substrate-binding domain-containing protein [Pseudomonas abietaniphila]SDG56028.1 LysR family transcriptional regulator, glycine cleavage system transcriptional activator [Pseudomonas abietaniphila]
MAAIKFPSMAALRGFEACVRHLNFSQAALELHVTQSAISHQVRQLEELLGTELFDRSAGAIVVTQAGIELLPIVRQFLKDFAALATRFEREAPGSSQIELFVHDSFANTWLIPRLPSFYASHPDIQIQLNTEDFSRFDNANGQAAIRLESQEAAWPGFYSEYILAERTFPVCSPALVERLGRPETPADVLDFPLILRSRSMANGEQISTPSWDYWLQRNALTPSSLNCALVVPHSNMAVSAAIRGLGVAMARTSHISDELRTGTLQKLLDEEMESDTGYHFLCSSGKQNSPEIRAVLEWLKTEIRGATP